MALVRYMKITTCRICSQIIRGDIGCVTATVAILMTFFVAMTLMSTYKYPTILTVLDDLKVDFKDLQKDTVNTVLLEQDNGEAYIAFRLKQSAKLLKTIQKSRVDVDDPHVSEAVKAKTTINPNESERTDRKSKETKDEVISLSEPVPTYPITTYNNPYLLNSKNVCAKQKSLSFLVIVHSSTAHFMRRASIRETWANYRLFHNHTMRIVFLIGKPLKDSTQLLIEHEHKIYKDIVQGNFVDSYRNLTHKGVLGLRWITENCQQAKFIVKVDDDVFVNVFKLLERIEGNLNNKTKHIWCPVRPNGTSEIQRKSGKWKIESHVFKNMTHYPVTYCNGFFAVYTTDMVPELYEAAKVTPFFWVDDVYLFGLLPDKVGGVKHLRMENLNLNENEAKKCFESKEKPCQMLVANAHSDGIMDQLWFRALDQYKTLVIKYSRDTLFAKT